MRAGAAEAASVRLMVFAAVSLVEVSARKKRTLWHPQFEPSDQFVKPWWGPESTVYASDRWVSGWRDGVEVARCKFVLNEEPCSHRSLGDMPHGQLDILALEVAVSARGQGVGRAVLHGLRELHPRPRLTALNDDAQSRGFWDAVGWVRHESRFTGVERVTYSEV